MPAPGSKEIKIVVNEAIHLTEILRSDKRANVEYLKEKEIYDHTLRIPYPYTEADFDKWFATLEKNTLDHGRPISFAIRNAEGHFLGACGFENFEMGKAHRTEFGYWLAKPCWGRGIMTAVGRKACEIAFAEWGFVKITAGVFAFNAASARVLEKCGFVQEGYLRKHYLKDGKYIDSKLYARLK